MKSLLFIRTSKKAVAVLMVAVILMGIFSGCGKKATDKNEAGQTVISIGGWPTQEGTDLNNWNERKAKFEKDNPDFAIEPDPWLFDLKSFYSKAAGGTLPTLYNCYFTEMPQIKDMGYSKELTKALKDNGLLDKLNPKVLEAVSDKEGNVYGFPYSAYVLGLAYNVDLFEKSGLMNADGTPKQPETWDDVVEFSKIINEKTGKAGFMLPTMNNYGGWLCMPIMWSYGVDFMELDENDKWVATFNTKEAVAALQFIKDLKWKHQIVPQNTLIDSNEYFKQYSIGEVGMIIGSNDATGQAKTYGMDVNDFGMMAMPKGPKRHVTLLGGNVYCIAPDATDDQADGVIKWIKMKYTHEVSEDFKTHAIKSAELAVENGKALGIKGLSIWSDNAESVKYSDEVIKKYANADLNHVILYNDFLKSNVEIQAEEPVCAQELYGILDSCIQEVWTNKNADCADLIKKACNDFQKNYLDNVGF